MFIWLIDVPIVLLIIMGLFLIVGVQVLAEAVLTAILAPIASVLAVGGLVGVLMLAVAFVLFWVTVVMQHYDERKTNTCDRIMRMLGIRGAILSVVGFLAYVAFITWF